jgi:hypothetical protein
MTYTRKVFVESVGVLFGTFTLIVIMSWGRLLGASPGETGIALAIAIGVIMIHRLTEAVRGRK